MRGENIMKRIIALLLLAVLFILTACGASKPIPAKVDEVLIAYRGNQVPMPSEKRRLTARQSCISPKA